MQPFRLSNRINSVTNDNIKEETKEFDISIKNLESELLTNEEDIEFKNDNSFKSIDSNDINLKSFLSTIAFVDDLCKISVEMDSKLKISDKYEFLRQEITKINKKLPSNVYVPFLNESVRNYLICHIPVSECVIFKTKSRAPYMILVELFRIDEITDYFCKEKGFCIKQTANDSLSIKKEKPASSKRSRANSLLILKQKENALNNSNIRRTLMDHYEEEVKVKDNTVTVSTERKRAQTQRLLFESDLKISRPLTIKDLEASRRTFIRENKIILEENEDLEDSYINSNKDIDDIISRKNSLMISNSLRNDRVPAKDLQLSNSIDCSFSLKNRSNTSFSQDKDKKRKSDEIKFTVDVPITEELENHSNSKEIGNVF